MEMMACTDLAVPNEIMRHVVNVESSFNPYAIGVVGGRLARQPKNLAEAVSTTRMLEREGYNFSLGIAQVNRYNLNRHGLDSYEKAFNVCPNLQAGSRILAECYARSGNDWGKAFSCYYSGNFTTGFRHGYVDKVMTSWRGASTQTVASNAIPVIRNGVPAGTTTYRRVVRDQATERLARRVEEAALSRLLPATSGQPQATQQMPAVPMQAPAPVAAVDPRTAGAVPTSDAPVRVQPIGGAPNVWPGAAQQAQPMAAPGSSSTGMAGAPAPGMPATAAPPRDAALVF
ncbi:transglycosylase SLT domain-containing protein [Stenotrophomonas sp. NPDC077659]|uniref:lytic transglycosylase domain-containing protein n=1 Tax=Stenotrophomonas sp. NPDC077659 TaxID=3390694 RepID=UPI003CFDDD08